MPRFLVKVSKTDGSAMTREEVNDIAPRLEAAGVVTAAGYDTESSFGHVLVHLDTVAPKDARDRVAAVLSGDEYMVGEATEYRED